MVHNPRIGSKRLVLLASAATMFPSGLAAQETVSPATPPNAMGTQPLAPASSSGASATDAAPSLGSAPASDDGDVIIVTATRRETTVQSAPINIAAVGSDQIEAQRLNNLRELVRQVPGVYIPDTGARNGSQIVFRGLNADPLTAGDGDNDGGGTVATYVGEIPLYVDLRLNDIERVEFLAGPQGTLYGAGTLGGAIRYIPKRPQFDRRTAEARAEGYGYTHGRGLSYNVGGTLNLPITPTLAFRASLDRTDDRGFIDQPYVVRQPGVSNPDPDFTNPADVAANTRRERDVNTDRVWAGRAALRWQPVDAVDANLTYYYQQQKTDGRQASSQVVTTFPVGVGKYDNLKRVLEPNKRTNQLLALEVSADLGFATLTSATGRSWFKDDGRRDQTDLLIGLEYSYEAFPSFTAVTEEKDKEKTFTQELRLVSKNDGPFSWIAGLFYNKQTISGFSKEFTPGYSEFLVASDPVTFPGPTRPDNLEYYSVERDKLTEKAAYGEVSYKITPKWQVTAGGRYYSYKLDTRLAVDIPLFDTVSGNRGPNDIILDFEPGGQKDSGFLYKFNTSYQINRDVLVYATASQGFRIGNTNGVAPCDTGSGSGPPSVCGQPNELEYKPDKTNNYEIGIKSQWFDRKLTVNAAVYYIDWQDPQVDSSTQIGLQPITINGGGARTRGLELLVAARPTSRLSLRLSYAYTDPELTKRSPNLVSAINPPGFQSTLTFEDGQRGDRLPGSPHHSGSFYAEYALPLSDNLSVNLSYAISGQSNVFTRTGARGGSYVLPGFTRSDIAARLASETGQWSLTAYIDNVFNKFSQTGVSTNPRYNQVLTDANGDPVYVRTFYTYVLPPRQFGLRFVKTFEGF